MLPWLRGQVSQQKRFIGTVQSDEKILRFVNSHDAPRLAELGTSCPGPFPAHQDQAALRGLEPAGRGCGGAQIEAGGGPRTIPQGLRRLLREVQARQLAEDARPEPDGGAHSRVGHDRLGQGQVGVARDGRVLQLRGGSDARRGSHRRIYLVAAAGSLRHRILAA